MNGRQKLAWWEFYDLIWHRKEMKPAKKTKRIGLGGEYKEDKTGVLLCIK